MTASLPTRPGDWHRRVLQLTWPVILANITIPLVSTVDTAVMGQLPDPAYIGAVAVGAQMFTAMYWLFGFLRMATTGLTAQAWGSAQLASLARVTQRGLALALCIGTLIVLLQKPLVAMMVALFDASETVTTLSSTYFLIRVWGAPALLAQLVLLGTLFGLQRMRATLVISLLYNSVNIVLDLLFVLVFEWGVEGVATATVISEYLAALIAFIAVQGAFRRANISWPSFQGLFRASGLAQFFDVSGNLIVRSFFVQLPFFLVTLLGARLGDVTLAANAVLMQLFMLMAFAIDGFALTAETLTGYAYGAREPQNVRRAAIYNTVWGLAFATVIATAFALFGNDIVALISQSPEVRATAATYLWWMVICPIVAVWAFLGDGIFIGTTHVAELRNSMFVSALLFVFGVWLMLEPYGNHGLWAAFTLFMVIRGITLTLYYPRIERAAQASAAA